MKYWEIKISIDKDYSDELVDLLEELQIPGYYEVLFDSSEPKLDETILRTNTTIKAYLNPEDTDKDIQIRIFLKSICPDSHSIESREIETREYEEAYKEYYKPFYLGKIWVIPVWERENPAIAKQMKHGDLSLYLNPGVAFGTGHHETTQMLLEILPLFIPTNKRVLDLGTGSGILSLACGLLGAESVFSVDIDPNAVQAAISNWKENTYPSNCKFIAEVGGLDHSPIFDRSYDLVLANITYAILSQNIKHISKLDSPNFLFSGIISERLDEFLGLLNTNIPGKSIEIREKNGWEMIQWQRT